MKLEWAKADSLVVAIHVDTTEQQTGTQMSAWGDCTPFPGDASARYCTYLKAQTKNIAYNVSVGYEDLDLSNRYMDFDYNDWVTDIAGDLRYCRTAEQGSLCGKSTLTSPLRHAGQAWTMLTTSTSRQTSSPATVQPSSPVTIRTAM